MDAIILHVDASKITDPKEREALCSYMHLLEEQTNGYTPYEASVFTGDNTQDIDKILWYIDNANPSTSMETLPNSIEDQEGVVDFMEVCNNYIPLLMHLRKRHELDVGQMDLLNTVRSEWDHNHKG